MTSPGLDRDALIPTRASLLKRPARWQDRERWRFFFNSAARRMLIA
jgi:hypothetical protein